MVVRQLITNQEESFKQGGLFSAPRKLARRMTRGSALAAPSETPEQFSLDLEGRRQRPAAPLARGAARRRVAQMCNKNKLSI